MFRCLLFISLVSFTLTSPASEPPALPQEFRGAWVATVANIDWPSRKGLTESEQKSELIKIFDRCVELNLNAVIFQVRPMCDALYRSDLEPWSAFLTGTMGKDPGYDPLAFAVEEAHRRGLELHAWCNPYRAGHPNDKSEPTANHLQKSRPELVKHYGSQIWLNPTHPDVAKHTLRVLADITQRYDIDGIHLDDYFYPYPEKNAQNENVPFDDEDTWQAYLASGGQLTRSDWRRNAVDEFVKRWYQETKSIKPWVKVGISPFGIWRPGHPPVSKASINSKQSTRMQRNGSMKALSTISPLNSTGPSPKKNKATRNCYPGGRAKTPNNVTFGQEISPVVSPVMPKAGLPTKSPTKSLSPARLQAHPAISTSA